MFVSIGILLKQKEAKKISGWFTIPGNFGRFLELRKMKNANQTKFRNTNANSSEASSTKKKWKYEWNQARIVYHKIKGHGERALVLTLTYNDTTIIQRIPVRDPVVVRFNSFFQKEERLNGLNT